jgi:glycosyltransferase involved in cell wall biosynthesis
VRICLVYDCLYPWTVGGAERWYRNVAERLAADGHDVTYLTLRQWPRREPPSIPGVRIVPVGPRLALYTDDGRRKIGPPLVFGAGVLWHLLRFGARYDAVHTCSFPFFSVLAAALVRPLRRFRLVVDWFEVWTRGYWERYLGRAGGLVGWAVQALCMRVPQRAFCFSELHARRLREGRVAGEVEILAGLQAGIADTAAAEPAHAEPVVVFAGRHIPEKRVPALVHGFAEARRHAPDLRLVILGDGPQRGQVLEAIAAEGLTGVASAPGFVDREEVDRRLATATCMVLPSEREGYGLVVVESAARGVPSVVVAGPDNAAVELVEDGVNGVVAASASPADLGAAILRVRDAGPALRASTAAWFQRNARRLSLEASLDRVADAYGREAATTRS